ncbi:hypothetical protein QE152_g4599 [Popillia japonica]|uniref:Uncharacterized protein n=1 Tax=Popillia japonica TaxID=7064 RepID=A0AAW1MUJ4_POPJA
MEQIQKNQMSFLKFYKSGTNKFNYGKTIKVWTNMEQIQKNQMSFLKFYKSGTNKLDLQLLLILGLRRNSRGKNDSRKMKNVLSRMEILRMPENLRIEALKYDGNERRLRH